MPTYNSVKTVEQSIRSVINQTYANWELLVIDDASQDETPHLLKTLAEKDARIRLHFNHQNAGVAQTRNKGIANAQGKWLAFLDSDDYWHQEKLAKQFVFIEATGAEISYTSTAYMNEAGQLSDYILHAKHELTYKTLLRRNLMSCSSVMVRRDMMMKFPFADGVLSEDYAAWMQIVKQVGCAYGLDEALLCYRLCAGSKSASRFRSGFMTYKAYRQAGYGCPRSAFLTVRYSLHSISKRMRIHLGSLRKIKEG